MTTLPIPRTTVEMLVRQRDLALSRYQSAFDALSNASDAIDLARQGLAAVLTHRNSYNHHISEEKAVFHFGIEVPEHAAYMATARKIVDTEVWAHLISVAGFDRLMDKKAKDEFRQQLMKDPPEVTEDNVFATLERLLLEADTIFKRGIAACFSSLDRRFKSHDGWEIGARVILSYVFDRYGSWCYHRNLEDTMWDIERVFYTLDGKPTPAACQIVQELRSNRNYSGAQQTFVETEYFRVRAFKNGNAHIWFKRDDLLTKVNQLLGEYYGAPIPQEREAEEDTGLFTPKTQVAKNYGFFPTPEAAVELVFEHVYLGRQKGEPRIRILEPSAGTGNLARRCLKNDKRGYRADYVLDPIVDCVEIQPELADGLRRAGIFGQVYTADFLALKPETTGLYDQVVMNPAFDRERDIDHVIHALRFLKPGGRLVAVMSAGTEFRQTRKSEAFRQLMKDMRAEWRDLPAGSFSSVGTNCNTVILRVTKRAEANIQTAEAA